VEPQYKHNATPAAEPESDSHSEEEYELKWHVRDGKHDFPGRTDWGEDPDHFNFNHGGLESHNRYRKPLDYNDIIRPNAPKKERHSKSSLNHEEHVFAHQEPEAPEALTTDFSEFVRDRDADYGKSTRRSSRREEPIPDAYDYSDLNWALKSFKDDNPHDHYEDELPKVRKNSYSRFSYMKSADDFGDESCGSDCEHDDVHALDKPGEVPARRTFEVEKRDDRRSKHSHKADSIEPTLANADLVRDFDART